MNSLQAVLFVVFALAELLILFVGTFLLLFLERFVHARTEHRDGPGRGGKLDYLQVWSDFLKVHRKERDPESALPNRFGLLLFAWAALPAIFMLVLFSSLLPHELSEAELPLLLMLPLIAAGGEAIFMHGTQSNTERYMWRKRLMLRIMGASALYLAVMAVALRVGHSSLESISALQLNFPYHSILSSFGLFFCGVGAFAAIFLFVGENPVQSEEELSLNRSLQYLLFFVNKMWIFCLLCFWVLVFFGGTGGLIAQVVFPIKVLVALFVFTLLQVSFPRVRTVDAAELTARWLLRLCLMGFVLEAVWVGVWP
jgi:NADH:ubiquinone oxidoreductase subunit H